MNYIKAINMDLKVIDTMVLIGALDYLIADTDRSEIDRAHAEKLRQKFDCELRKRGIEIGD